MMRCRKTLLPLALLAIASCTGTNVDLTPIIASNGTTGDQSGGISSNITPINTTDLAQIEGRYAYDNDECTTEQRENTSPNLNRLNAIRSQSGEIQFVITLNPVATTTTTTTTVADRTIDLLDLTQGTTRKETLQLTPSGIFTTMTLLTRTCGLEFVKGGAVATCKYSDIPATCTWYLIRR